MRGQSFEVFNNAPVPKAVLSNVIPSIVSMIMVLIYNLADTFFIGQTNSKEMLNAVAYVTPAFLIFMAIGMLFGIGGTSFISRKLGAGDGEITKKISAFCFWSGIIVGLICMLGIIVFIKPLTSLIGAKPGKANSSTIANTRSYFSIVSLSLPFLIVSGAFSNIIRAEGKVNVAMAGNIFGNLVNIVLDPIMISALNWGIVGAAVATVLGNVTASTFYVVHLLSKRSILSINPKHFKMRGGIASNVFKIGIPASLNSILLSVSNIITNNFMGEFSDNAVGALGVAFKVNMITVMLLIGLGTGIQPLLGFCFGSNNYKRFKDVMKFSLFCAVVLSVVMTLISLFAALPLVRAFVKNNEQVAYGSEFVRILIISGPILGVLFVMINAIQSMGEAVSSLILSASRQGIIYLPLLLIVRALTETEAMLVMAQPITDYIATSLAIVLFIIAMRKFKKRFAKLQNEQELMENVDGVSEVDLSLKSEQTTNFSD